MLSKIFEDEKDGPIDGQITDVLDRMSKVGPDSEDYPRLMTLLERLHALKVKERREPVSRDTLAIIAGNLFGILLIVAYENKHVITSKGFNQILRLRTN